MNKEFGKNILYAYGIPGVITFGTVLVSNFVTIKKSAGWGVFQTEPEFMSMIIFTKALYYGITWPHFLYDLAKEPGNALKMNFYDFEIEREEKK